MTGGNSVRNSTSNSSPGFFYRFTVDSGVKDRYHKVVAVRNSLRSHKRGNRILEGIVLSPVVESGGKPIGYDLRGENLPDLETVENLINCAGAMKDVGNKYQLVVVTNREVELEGLLKEKDGELEKTLEDNEQELAIARRDLIAAEGAKAEAERLCDVALDENTSLTARIEELKTNSRAMTTGEYAAIDERAVKLQHQRPSFVATTMALSELCDNYLGEKLSQFDQEAEFTDSFFAMLIGLWDPADRPRVSRAIISQVEIVDGYDCARVYVGKGGKPKIPVRTFGSIQGREEKILLSLPEFADDSERRAAAIERINASASGELEEEINPAKWDDYKIVSLREIALAYGTPVDRVNREMQKASVATITTTEEDGLEIPVYQWNHVKEIFQNGFQTVDLITPAPQYRSIDESISLLGTKLAELREHAGTYVADQTPDIARISQLEAELVTAEELIAELITPKIVPIQTQDILTAEELHVKAFKLTETESFAAAQRVYGQIPVDRIHSLEIASKTELAYVLSALDHRELSPLLESGVRELEDVDDLVIDLERYVPTFFNTEFYSTSHFEYEGAKIFVENNPDLPDTSAKHDKLLEAEGIVERFRKAKVTYTRNRNVSQRILNDVEALREEYHIAITEAGDLLTETEGSLSDSPVLRCLAYISTEDTLEDTEARASFLLLSDFEDLQNPLGLQLAKTLSSELRPYGQGSKPISISNCQGSLRVDVNYQSAKLLQNNGLDTLAEVVRQSFEMSLLGYMGLQIEVTRLGEVSK